MIGDNVEVGINGLTDVEKLISARSYNSGSALLSGKAECGFSTSGATEETGWISFSPKDLPNEEVCVYTIQVRTNGFTGSSFGHVVIRRFIDPNIRPLETTVNHVKRSGVNWVQLKADPPNQPIRKFSGIYENRDIIVNLGNHEGTLHISGCDMPIDMIPYSKVGTKTITVDQLYRHIGKVDRDCLFMITANHNDGLAESASVFIKVYHEQGSFLDAPVVDIGWRACFRFQDPYVIGLRVNGAWANSNSLCVKKRDFYIVEAVTSNQRIFYGEHNGTNWTAMK